MTIESILVVSFPFVRDILRENDTLHKLEQEGKVQFKNMGVVVESAGIDYPIQELSTPIVWDMAYDDLPTNKQINFIKHLIEDAINLHESLLETITKDGTNLILSNTYHLQLSQVHLHGNIRRAQVYTAYAAIPKITNSKPALI